MGTWPTVCVTWPDLSTRRASQGKRYLVDKPPVAFNQAAPMKTLVLSAKAAYSDCIVFDRTGI